MNEVISWVVPALVVAAGIGGFAWITRKRDAADLRAPSWYWGSRRRRYDEQSDPVRTGKVTPVVAAAFEAVQGNRSSKAGRGRLGKRR